MEVSDFTPSTPQTGLKGFLLYSACSSPCDSLSKVSESMLLADPFFDWDGTTLSTSSRLYKEISFKYAANASRSDTATQMIQKNVNMKASDLKDFGMPNSTENFYYK